MRNPVLWNKEIEEIKSTGYLKENISITDALIENFYNEIMGEEEKILLDLLLSPNPLQSELDKLLELWDIESKQSAKSLLLAYLLKTHPDLKATKYEEPRLKGLLLNQRFINLKIISHFTKIGKELNKNGIFPLIFKGCLFKWLNPDFPRYMGDVDILVPEKQWIKSARIAKSLGYWFKKLDIHSFDILENKNSKYGILDIHKFIYIGTKSEKKWLKNLFKRATKKDVFGVETLVPTAEDALFITLINLSNNLRDHKSQATLLYAILDCKYLLEKNKNFNWQIVIENAKYAGAEVQINFAMKFIKKFSQTIIPKDIQNQMIFEKETNDYSRMIMFKHFYYIDLQKKSRDMKITEVLRNPSKIKEYLSLKIKYKTLKILNRYPRLIKFFIADLKMIYNN